MTENEWYHLGVDKGESVWPYYHDGVIDEVRVYRRTVSPLEVRSIYNRAAKPDWRQERCQTRY